MLVELNGNTYSLEFKKGLVLKKVDSTFFYGCPDCQSKTTGFCEKCNEKKMPNRIYLKAEEYNNPEITKAELEDKVPIWAMVENGFSWVVDNESLKAKLEQEQKVLKFLYAEKQGLNARPVWNYVFPFGEHLARIRADVEHKELISYDDVKPKSEKKKARKIIMAVKA